MIHRRREYVPERPGVRAEDNEATPNGALARPLAAVRLLPSLGALGVRAGGAPTRSPARPLPRPPVKRAWKNLRLLQLPPAALKRRVSAAAAAASASAIDHNDVVCVCVDHSLARSLCDRRRERERERRISQKFNCSNQSQRSSVYTLYRLGLGRGKRRFVKN